MKNLSISDVLNILLVVIVIILVSKDTSSKVSKESMVYAAQSKKDAVLSVIHNRKSVRKYTSQNVKKEDMEILLKAAMAAPTGHNAQPWQFIAIKDTSTIHKFHKGLPWNKQLLEANAAIVVCGDMKKVHEYDPEFWITDASAASQNILLAIEAMGLGGVWCTLYPGNDRMDLARNILNLPDYIMPLCIIPIGYPTGIEKPKNKFKPENIHWEHW